ncbi:hypothetical protein EVAR_61986_1 [Eumeta japonica]|uniref:Uncharacterized protein n=1 Tax=Eumeta variegata TaxID=151549 RepID=A0A4C1YIP1_EUMVA|nr:hypothetical protein EVAR_61986_1 [Eumeta japonica]
MTAMNEVALTGRVRDAAHDARCVTGMSVVNSNLRSVNTARRLEDELEHGRNRERAPRAARPRKCQRQPRRPTAAACFVVRVEGGPTSNREPPK